MNRGKKLLEMALQDRNASVTPIDYETTYHQNNSEDAEIEYLLNKFDSGKLLPISTSEDHDVTLMPLEIDTATCSDTRLVTLQPVVFNRESKDDMPSEKLQGMQEEDRECSSDNSQETFAVLQPVTFNEEPDENIILCEESRTSDESDPDYNPNDGEEDDVIPATSEDEMEQTKVTKNEVVNIPTKKIRHKRINMNKDDWEYNTNKKRREQGVSYKGKKKDNEKWDYNISKPARLKCSM
uniref:Uncharacterized protein n=1 Tax=Photinus pyralis TaxID=7054 RepID=A0A1Y1MRH0_PHOPY